MRLATLREGGRDGTLVVVRRDAQLFARATSIAPSLQRAVDDWDQAAPQLLSLQQRLDNGDVPGEPLRYEALAAPLPRAYEWLDGSAFLAHVRRVRRARGADLPPELLTDPLMYQGGSGVLLGPRDPMLHVGSDPGLDFESEVAVILGDVPLGVSPEQALTHVRLLCLVNDVTLRKLVPDELAKGFGFLQSKPSTAFSPFVVTPDEVGPAWREGRLHLRVRTELNGQVVGDCDAAEMHFGFGQLIAHAARTRRLTAGTILGSGTVANEDAGRGVSCLVEKRSIETVEAGGARTRFLVAGDLVRIEAVDDSGRSVFGAIEQKVVMT
jgi:fumarylacetoacetate (FAA) hydrolase